MWSLHFNWRIWTITINLIKQCVLQCVTRLEVVSTMEEEVQRGKEGQACSGGCVSVSGVIRGTVMERVAFEQRLGKVREFSLQIPGGNRAWRQQHAWHSQGITRSQWDWHSK